MATVDRRIPVIAAADELNIPWRTLQTIIAGRSLLGTFELHVGLRFVTQDIFAAILLIRFLRSRHVFMYANVLPQEIEELAG